MTCLKVGSNALAEALRLTDVDNATGAVFEQVDSRRSGKACDLGGYKVLVVRFRGGSLHVRPASILQAPRTLTSSQVGANRMLGNSQARAR